MKLLHHLVADFVKWHKILNSYYQLSECDVFIALMIKLASINLSKSAINYDTNVGLNDTIYALHPQRDNAVNLWEPRRLLALPSSFSNMIILRHYRESLYVKFSKVLGFTRVCLMKEIFLACWQDMILDTITTGHQMVSCTYGIVWL